VADGAYRRVTACRLCDSPNLSTALDLGETPLANELDGTELFPLVVMRCDDCEHHQLSIAVNPERLWGPSYPYQSGTSPVFRAHLEKLADEVAALKPGGRVLEIASNDGTLVKAMQLRGVDAYGTDPSGPDAWMSKGLLNEAWPNPAKALLLGGLTGAEKPFDVILALNVFAHVDDLHSFTAAVKEALAPDGVFIVEVGYLPDVIERGLFDVLYHEHFSYHTVAPLRRFFARHGLVISRCLRIDSQGGSIRLYVEHAGKEYVDEPRDEERDISKLRERITLTRAGLSLALEGMTTIAGYGCPAKLTTLSYACKIPDLVCVFDDNPLKVGHKTPGSGWPIVPTSELLDLNPDALILFSWNFASEIIPRLRARGYKGRIVTPLPEVEVDEA
jgi:SAM-dependent methyltransferase